MNGMELHLRKDLKMLSSDQAFPFFVTFLVIVCAVSVTVSLLSYQANTSDSKDWALSASSVANAELWISSQYWGYVMLIFALLFTGASSLAMSNERGSGMVKYILTGPVDYVQFFLSKYVVLLAMSALAVIIALLAYVVAFPLLDLGLMAPSEYLAKCAYLFMAMAVFSALGLLTSTLADKKGMTVAVAIVLFFLLIMLMQMSIGLTGSGGASSAPLPIQAMIYGNPLVITYADSADYAILNGFQAGLLACAQAGLLLIAGLAIFSQERPRNDDLQSAPQLRSF